MGAFFYFFPGKPAAPRKVFKAAGLGYLFDSGTSVTFGGMSPGPNGDTGAIAVVGAPPPPVAGVNDVKKENWLDCGEYWVGFAGDAPGPRDLERASLVDGHDVHLGDGNPWLIPVARHYDGSTPLPRPIRWNPKRGYHTGEVEQQHRELFAGAQHAWDCLMCALSGSGTASLDVETSFDLIAVALGTNYRIGPAEIGLLGILTTANRSDVVKAIVDWPGAEAYLKKKACCRLSTFNAWRSRMIPHAPSVAELYMAGSNPSHGPRGEG